MKSHSSSVVASGWVEGSTVVSVGGERRSMVRRNSNRCDSETGEHSLERSGRKEGKYLIDKQII